MERSFGLIVKHHTAGGRARGGCLGIWIKIWGRTHALGTFAASGTARPTGPRPCELRASPTSPKTFGASASSLLSRKRRERRHCRERTVSLQLSDCGFDIPQPAFRVPQLSLSCPHQPASLLRLLITDYRSLPTNPIVPLNFGASSSILKFTAYNDSIRSISS